MMNNFVFWLSILFFQTIKERLHYIESYIHRYLQAAISTQQTVLRKDFIKFPHVFYVKNVRRTLEYVFSSDKEFTVKKKQKTLQQSKKRY